MQHQLDTHQAEDFVELHSMNQFHAWDQRRRRKQIAQVCCLTGLLYLIFSVIPKPWASAEAQNAMLTLYTLLIAPGLLIISFLAFKSRYVKWIEPLLAIHILLAAICHVYINAKLEVFEPLLAEGYLMVIWTFIVSGLTPRFAVLSALLSLITFSIYACLALADSPLFYIHLFWLGCSFSFGLAGALIYDHSRRAEFATQLAYRELAVTDPLTQCFNRNELERRLKIEIPRCEREDQSFSVLMLDLDNFKAVNDTFGHEAGDLALAQTANVIRQSIRKSDTFIRWGGEEFLILTLNQAPEQALAMAEKLRLLIQTCQYDNGLQLTVSIGVTIYYLGDQQTDLINRADSGLYQAKSEGRNCCRFVGT
ncbi:GGDEF domain-containing protein [Umboniibacter marinipuniceus]|uniref:diguanylate cyclase n=1 Tax=Umboniibacter marinipuniceus TaxID=569599 RepID=A0A3M0A7W1_9GAMM|nr:GGDEF domain-containing protein [Umboniibacter marinipuniceus]RMA81241.1 diguanylate cyclase (GGDEF)-like protein [Umboniibacter marinipuniceus]